MKKIISVILLFICFSAINFADVERAYLLKMGSESEQVKLVQEVLASEGFYKGEIDGVFGEGTQLSVILYQESQQLQADGIVGEETLAHLFGENHQETTLVEKALENVQEAIVSRGVSRGTVPPGAYLDWWKDIKDKMVFPDDEFLIKDFETGRVFNVVAIAGTKHMDVEALTLADAKIIQSLWGGYSWERRPVIAYIDGVAVAASLNGMPHAGRDDKPYKDYVDNRSSGYGYGYNYDKIKGNDFEGVICLHFKNSLLHKNAVADGKHQAAVRKAAGLE